MKITSNDVIDALHTLGDEVASFRMPVGQEIDLADLYKMCRMAPDMTWSGAAEFRDLSGYVICTLQNAVTTIHQNQAASTLPPRFSTKEILAKWPEDAVAITNIYGHIFDKDTVKATSDTTSWNGATFFIDPKGHKICDIKDLFGDLVFEWEDDAVTAKIDTTKLCMPHEKADTPMQRCDEVGQSKWWIYCKKCGDWLWEAPVPGNGGK